MTFGSLFSGIGGMDLGLERSGMQCRWQVEIDDYCSRVLAKHWPEVKRYRDVRTVQPAELEPVDLICGGFPCQPVSVAGRRKRQDDERWLWPEFARIVRDMQPRWVLIENVPGLLAGDWAEMEDPAADPLWRSGMSDVLGELAGCGYDAEWDCIPAAALGAPHLRYRTFIVAYPHGEWKQQLEGIISHQSGRFDYKTESADAPRFGRQERTSTATQARNGEGKSSRRQSGRLPADTIGLHDDAGRHGASQVRGERSEPAEICRRRIFADAPSQRLQERQNADLVRELQTLERSFTDTAELRRKRKSRSAPGRWQGQTKPCKRDPSEEIYGSGWWAAEPRLVRMVHGIPHRVDRIRGLGNAVIPQVAEWIGCKILEAESYRSS